MINQLVCCTSLALMENANNTSLSIILFEVFPEKSVWSVPVTQADEYMIAVPA